MVRTTCDPGRTHSVLLGVEEISQFPRNSCSADLRTSHQSEHEHCSLERAQCPRNLDALPKTLLVSIRHLGVDKMAPACFLEGADIIQMPALLTQRGELAL